jgi:hypothetical protein
LAIATPWYALATLRNPPYFAFSLHSGPGEYRGFFWFYFFNEPFCVFWAYGTRATTTRFPGSGSGF